MKISPETVDKDKLLAWLENQHGEAYWYILKTLAIAIENGELKK